MKDSSNERGLHENRCQVLPAISFLLEFKWSAKHKIKCKLEWSPNEVEQNENVFCVLTYAETYLSPCISEFRK